MSKGFKLIHFLSDHTSVHVFVLIPIISITIITIKDEKQISLKFLIHSRCGIGIGVCFFLQYIIKFPTFKSIIMQAEQVALGSAMMKIFEEDLWKIFSFWKVKYHKTLVAIQQHGSFLKRSNMGFRIASLDFSFSFF